MPACLSGHIDERMEQTKVEQGIDRKLCRLFYENMKRYLKKIIINFTLINTNIN